MFSSNTSAVSGDTTFIEDVFSTWLYTGTGASLAITNGIDLAGKGGLVWLKKRNAAVGHQLTDTARGAANALFTESTAAQGGSSFTSFNSSGFTLPAGGTRANNLNDTYASWTFREQAKFFDVVTYTGTGATGQVISHNLGSVPGCIIVKRTSGTAEWYVWHRSLTSTSFAVLLNDTTAEFASGSFLTATPTSTTFSLKPPSFNPNGVNGNGSTYVAYVFAHDAGGFGLAGTDNVITCGSYTGNGSTTGPVVSLGYEPQWLMIKGIDNTSGWQMIDTMRGMPVGSADAVLSANTTAAEVTGDYLTPTATGFQIVSSASEVNLNTGRYIYIAIRRGPMKTPTSGASVFQPVAYTGTAATRNITGASFPPDLSINQARVVGSGWGAAWYDRLRGPNRFVRSSGAAAENSTYTDELTTFNMNGVTLGISANGVTNNNAQGYVDWLFGRAPGFFDEVCYTGTGVARTVTHNLGVVPELMIIKIRSAVAAWQVYSAALGNTTRLFLNDPSNALTGATIWNSTSPTASVFSVDASGVVNQSGSTFVAYLFASCPGVSKVGSYTGTGGTQTISCGFAARFVLIKRTDSTGDWFVWDTARGMVAGTDPRLALNTAAAETNANWVYTDASGFQIVTTDATVNASGGTYIYLCIA